MSTVQHRPTKGYGGSWVDGVSSVALAADYKVSVVLLIIAFLVKVGSFPFHGWVVPLYRKIGLTNLQVFLTIVPVGFNLAFIHLMVGVVGFSYTGPSVVYYVVGVSCVGSILCGGYIMFTHNSIRTFLAGNAIVNSGFLMYAVIGLTHQLTLGGVSYLGVTASVYVLWYAINVLISLSV